MAEPSRLASALEYLGGLDAAVAPKLRAVSDAIDPVNVARRAGLNLPTGAQATEAAHFVGPGADIEGMVNDAREGNAAFGRGDLLGALGGYGSAAMAIPMMALPGSVKDVKAGVKALSNALPMDEASRMARAADQNYNYARKSQSANSPENDVGYAMFVKKKNREESVSETLDGLESYGRHGWVASEKGATPVEDIQKDIVRALRNSGEYKDYQTTAAALARDAAPKDIVNSAGLWDNPDLVSTIYESVLKPRGITAVKTPDGLISFGHQSVRSENAAFDPAKINSRDLLASALAAGVFGAGVAGSTNKEPE